MRLLPFVVVGAALLLGGLASLYQEEGAVASGPAPKGGEATGKWMAQETVPFLFRDYQQLPNDGDPLAVAQEVWRWLNDTYVTFSTYNYNFQGLVERTWHFPNKDVRVVYYNFYVKDGEYIFSTTHGSRSLAEYNPYWDKVRSQWERGIISDEEYRKIRRELSRYEFDLLDRWLRNYFDAAIQDLDRDIVQITRLLRESVPEELRGRLDEPLPWPVDPPITLAEVLGLEVYTAYEYLPDVIYFGPIKAWGYMLAGPNVPVGRKPERRMGLHPQAVGFDYITGKHNIVLHELVHAWQSFPLGWWYDVELFNEIYSNSVDVYPLDFLYHSYLTRLRRIALRYWNFDADYAKSYIWSYSLGGVAEINPEHFYEMHRIVQEIYKELKNTFVPALYRTFYSDPLFWITLNDFMKDDAFTADVVAAMLYEPTCIDGSVRETTKWQKAHADEIMALWKETLEEMAEKKRKRSEEEKLPSSVLAVSWWGSLPLGLQEKLTELYTRGGMDAILRWMEEGGDLR